MNLSLSSAPLAMVWFYDTCALQLTDPSAKFGFEVGVWKIEIYFWFCSYWLRSDNLFITKNCCASSLPSVGFFLFYSCSFFLRWSPPYCSKCWISHRSSWVHCHQISSNKSFNSSRCSGELSLNLSIWYGDMCNGSHWSQHNQPRVIYSSAEVHGMEFQIVVKLFVTQDQVEDPRCSIPLLTRLAYVLEAITIFQLT